MNLPAALPTHPTAQQTPVQPVDVHDHELFGLLNLGHGVRFQAQLFSDKSFYKHLGPLPSSCSGKQLRKDSSGPRCCSTARQLASPSQSKGFNSSYTFRRGTRKINWTNSIA